MIHKKEKEKIETLIDDTFVSSSDALEWLSEKGFVEADKCYYYCYSDKNGNYIGNDSDDDPYDTLEILLKDIDYDEFMTKFNEEFGDKENE